MRPCPSSFTASAFGMWGITAITAICGQTLPQATGIDIGSAEPAPGASEWTLRGTAGNLRYTTQVGASELRVVQGALGQPSSRRAALIPIRKNEEWWAMAQDERDQVFRAAHHHAIGMPYARTIARKLYHSRELGEPFDFLTWFEFAPEHTGDFERLLEQLRASEEWRFIDREVDIRLRLED